MSSELEVLKQRIIELEAENAEIPELRKKLAEIPELRKKLAEVEARNVEIEARNAELMKQMIEENNRRDARIDKLEEKQLQNDNTPNNILSNFNSGVVHHEKPLEEKEMDNFLLEAHKKIVSSEIKQRNKEKKLLTESMTSSEQEVAKQSGQNSHKKKGTEKIVQVITDGMMAEPSIQDNIKHQESNSSNSKALHMTEISATARRPNCSSSLLDLAKLFDKATDAEYRTKKANEEEILCWVNFGKEFMVHFSELVENSNGKIGEKKAKGIIYDEMLEHLVTIREKRSKEMGIQLPKISRSSLTRRTQRSMKLVRIIEKIGIDKFKYLSEYSPNSISELTNDQIQEIIEASERRDNSAEQDDFPTPEISAGNLETSEKILPEENTSLSADLKDYIKTLTGAFVDETAYWGTPYENEARVAEEMNEEVASQSREETDESRSDNDSDSNDSEEEMPDDSDDDGYSGYGGYNEYGERDRGYYYRDGGYERKTSPMMSPIISPVTA
ncbi:hypothetical protein GLOIN_2v1835304 [Rhizophagus irregularis DAOM 181602=DAOM 197198]|uniref:Uncharacterized protein n=1 Tax=Rhizophagus irregularis (strain DAOM 181602 / DAOM 197198 / MUCL 43194) TaxID=747089 RepID=A0A2P4QU47_RHIID|nr:hypothetical protein GLOIN_2v1835304 [Rhizophagus irregularis DAOM 181602=DAOM 197198]POG81142.1 hypothetical protein GLOIN_2v1835304 [Rhizophagus irregularis DAOM 181602=DAOM 197198]|eukprot:XP_025188008.1 hypothetical protein GLOIN_2v1835304 [Rhizophagus irregularis DAOM 181602=DAOM 197198]